MATFSGGIGSDVTTLEVAQLLSVTPKTILNWMTKGMPRPGDAVLLPNIKLGKDRRTCVEALAWFLAAVNDIPDPSRLVAPLTRRLAELRQTAREEFGVHA